jgi:hypothetical protein
MAILNSGFLIENPMDMTEPLEKLIKVGFGLDRDAAVEELEVSLDDDEDDEEEAESADAGNNEEVEEVDLSTLDADNEEHEEHTEEL